MIINNKYNPEYVCTVYVSGTSTIEYFYQDGIIFQLYKNGGEYITMYLQFDDRIFNNLDISDCDLFYDKINEYMLNITPIYFNVNQKIGIKEIIKIKKRKKKIDLLLKIPII